jgi:hypothetical protein
LQVKSGVQIRQATNGLLREDLVDNELEGDMETTNNMDHSCEKHVRM